MSGRPASLLLVHGAGSGPWVFDGWADAFPGVRVGTVDLHEGVDVASASMRDYAARVTAAAAELRQPVGLCGWSMGGLVVLMAAADVRPHSVVLIEPSPPGDTQGFAPTVDLPTGTFDPEEVYGRFPQGMRARPESARARAERKCGISVPELSCSSLVVYGDDFAEERGRNIAHFYGSSEVHFPGLDHWALVRDPRVPRAIRHAIGP